MIDRGNFTAGLTKKKDKILALLACIALSPAGNRDLAGPALIRCGNFDLEMVEGGHNQSINLSML